MSQDTWEAEHLTQLEGYVHRYGPGLVVYWLGFEASIETDHHGITVVADFPGPLLFPAADAPTSRPLTEALSIFELSGPGASCSHVT